MLPLLMQTLLLAEMHRMWYAVPAVVSVSLVYAATRHEEMGPIVRHATRFGLGIIFFMGLIALVLQIWTWQIG